ncbi:MAG: ribbon-helix-helix domain-containing protein [Methyloceanibacter sp.]
MPAVRNKRSLTIARHRTSVSLEEPFWEALAELARDESKSIAGLVAEIDQTRSTDAREMSLSAAIRLHVLERVRGRGGYPPPKTL